MRILIRTSKWAIWSRRFGSLALPLTIVPVLLHRERLISSGDFAVLEAVAAAVALLALVLAVGGFGRLWMTGDRGWGRAGWGLCFALICLAPFAYLAVEAARYPAVNEITTDFTEPLALVSEYRVPPTSAALRDAASAAFPNVRTRTYPVEATQMFSIVSDLIEAQGWDVRIRRQPPTALDTGQINAIATTLFGWRDEVAVRVTGTTQGSIVDMRSVPLGAFHDFGSNGKRVEDFLLALDQKITLLLRNSGQVPAGEPDAGAATR